MSPAQGSMAGQLRALFSLDPDCPIAATPAFAPWLAPGESHPWPPTHPGGGGLWLVDSRDLSAEQIRTTVGKDRRPPSFEAALVLSGSGPPGSPLRKLFRNIRRPGTRRLPERNVRDALRIGSESWSVQRFAFDDDPGLPVDLEPDGDPGSSGAAFLLTREPPFSGPAWALARNHLPGKAFQVMSIQLRERGAAIAVVRSGQRDFVLRFVPRGGPLEVVKRNHSELERIRAVVASAHGLAELMPEPVFSNEHEETAIFGETYLQGVLAWTVASGPLEAPIRRNALACLENLKEATSQKTASSPEELDELIRCDLERADRFTYGSTDVRDLVRNELNNALVALAAEEITCHTSHGDFGYGNILVDRVSGEITGVIDWDTARTLDLPGMDRVNLEVQTLRMGSHDLPQSVKSVWESRSAQGVLAGPGGPTRERALFGLAVCRIIMRAFSYPAVYRREESEFRETLKWLTRVRGEDANT